MIRGETAYVRRVVGDGPMLGDPERVDGVLVVPSTGDEADYLRPDGIRSDVTLHFPRGYGRDLRGALVSVRGWDFRVVGSPMPYTEANVPGRWTMPVEAVRVDG